MTFKTMRCRNLVLLVAMSLPRACLTFRSGRYCSECRSINTFFYSPVQINKKETVVPRNQGSRTKTRGKVSFYVPSRRFSSSTNQNEPLTATSISGSVCNGRNLNLVMDVVQDAARKAGEVMREKAGVIDVKKFKANPRDIVTEADILCQQVIQSTISEAFPNDFFLGEESVDSGSDASIAALERALENGNDEDDVKKLLGDELVFVVDPIDGTTNFQAGLPMFCASIGAVHKATGDIVLGVIYNPILDEMTYAIRGQGAFTNGKRLGLEASSLPITTLGEAVLNVGFPAAMESALNVSSRAIKVLATKVRGLRMIASASQVMAWVAQGKFNAYVSWNLNSWDVCAGIIIVEEAQGFVSDMEGNRATVKSRDLVISSPGSRNVGALDKVVPGNIGVHEELLMLLIDNDCVKYS